MAIFLTNHHNPEWRPVPPQVVVCSDVMELSLMESPGCDSLHACCAAQINSPSTRTCSSKYSCSLLQRRVVAARSLSNSGNLNATPPPNATPPH